MEPSPTASPIPPGVAVTAAPFLYRRNRPSANLVDANATHRPGARATAKPPLVKHRMHAVRQHRAAGRATDMTTAVQERAKITKAAQEEAAQLAGTIRAAPPPTAGPGSPEDEGDASQLLKVEAVPACLEFLHYRRSERAWNALANGCVAKVKRLGEEDNDVVAWAASFILSRDAQQGMLLLESYVIATCIVLYEVHTGVLGRVQRGVNPFAKRRDGDGGGDKAKAAEAVANDLAQRRCLDRHNQLLLGWMRLRARGGEVSDTDLRPYDVKVSEVSEVTARQLVLQSMQLLDTIEIQRWYTTALMLYASEGVEAAGTAVVPKQVVRKSSAAARRRRRGQGPAMASVHETEIKCDIKTIFSQSCGVFDSTGEGETAPTSASDGYRAPRNLWFRLFFALYDGISAADDEKRRNPSLKAITGRTPHDRPARRSPRLRERRPSLTEEAAARITRTLSWIKEHGPLPKQRGRRGSTPEGHNSSSSSTASSSFSSGPAPWYRLAAAALDQERTCSLLLSHQAEWDVYFITAVTALYTRHYRTCMMAATRFLRWASEEEEKEKKRLTDDAGPLGSEGRSSADAKAPRRGLQAYQSRYALFLRAWAALQIGERLQFGKDVLVLMDDEDDALGYHVGCALALYGLPLPSVADSVLAVTQGFTHAPLQPYAERPLVFPVTPLVISLPTQCFIYLLAEAVHAVTLLQLGLVEQARVVANVAIAQAEVNRLGDEETMPLAVLRDVVVLTSTALEDARAILDLPLTTHRLTYISVCTSFFGGLCARGINVRAQSWTHRMLYPRNLPLYASTRQVIPFHMNRAVYLFHAGELKSAWDDACCAAAAADEVAGSVEFAFSDCFPLRVYHFACTVGFAVLEAMLTEDMSAAKAYLGAPLDTAALATKNTTLQENELLSKEVVHICRDIVRRLQYFYPHSRLTELCHVQLSMVCGGKDYLAQAVALSQRYPNHPASQNVLTLAFYYDHHISEAVDNARKNFQRFPHSSEVIRIRHMLQKENVTYTFNYRGVLSTQYKPGTHDRVFTKRMIIVIFLMLLNMIILGITVYANAPFITEMPDTVRLIAVRVQLPTPAPILFAAPFTMHAIIAAVTPRNLISTLLEDLYFVNTPLNRALFCLRCIPLVNLVNAVMISAAGNNFLFDNGGLTFLVFLCLSVLFVPFTSRVWFLPSVDEPAIGLMSWLALLGVDCVMALLVVVPHIIIAFLEPYMLVLFYFFTPVVRPGEEIGFPEPSSSVRRRLLLHAKEGANMPQRFTIGSGSHFVHIVALKWLYAGTHSTMDTRFLAAAQLEAESYRVFPLLEGEMADTLYAEIPHTPLYGVVTSVQETAPEPQPCTVSADTGGWRLPVAPVATRDGLRGARYTPNAQELQPVRSTSGDSPVAYYASPTTVVTDAGRPAGAADPSSHYTTQEVEEEEVPLDGTLMAGTRTVDAVRQLMNLGRTDAAGTQHNTASFMNPKGSRRRGGDDSARQMNTVGRRDPGVCARSSNAGTPRFSDAIFVPHVSKTPSASAGNANRPLTRPEGSRRTRAPEHHRWSSSDADDEASR